MISKTKSKNCFWNKSFIMIAFSLIILTSLASFNIVEKTKPVRKDENSNTDLIAGANKKEHLFPKLNGPKDSIPDNDLIVSASPVKMNVLYIGVDNPVSIAVSGISMDKVTACINVGTISGEKGNFIARVKDTSVKSALITIYVDGKVVSTKEFRIKKLADPFVRIAISNKNPISIKELIEAGGLESSLSNFDFYIKFEILGFTMRAREGDYTKLLKQENGHKFTPEQIELIKKLQTEEIIYFEDIMVKAPDGTIRNIGNLVVQID